MIDLGVELADFGRLPSGPQQAAFTLADLHGMRVWTGGGVNVGRLSDLQAQGFNTTPPPGFAGPRHRRYNLDWLRDVLWDEDR